LFSPATFLYAIARHVAPFLASPSPSSPSRQSEKWNESTISRFATLISVGSDWATPPSEASGDWLQAKLTNKIDELYEQDGVAFPTLHVLSDEAMPETNDAGMVVFCTPLKTWDSPKAKR